MKSDNRKSPLDAAISEALASCVTPLAPSPEASARMRQQLFQRVHAPVADYLFVHSHQGKWITLLQGIDFKLLREGEGVRSSLSRRAPGARIPPHDHSLDEENLVLEGAVTVNGVRCGPGDYHYAPSGKSHDWVTSDTGCLLFIRGATAQHAPR